MLLLYYIDIYLGTYYTIATTWETMHVAMHDVRDIVIASYLYTNIAD